MVEPSPTEFRAGVIIGDAFDVLSRNFLRFFLISAVVRLPAAIFLFFVVAWISVEATAGTASWVSPGVIFLGVLVIAVVNLLFSMLITGLLQCLSFQSIRGQEMAVGPALGKVMGRIVPLVLVSLVYGILVTVGTILLIVPGVIIALILSVVVPVCLLEDKGVFESLGRSAELTKGHRGTIFLAWILYGLIAIAATIAVAIVIFILNLIVHSAIVSQIVNFILSAALAAFLGPMIAVIYYRLRVLKDGVDIHQIAAVFD